MQSNGGLMRIDVATSYPNETLLSALRPGVILGPTWPGRPAGEKLITLDMGGTSPTSASSPGRRSGDRQGRIAGQDIGTPMIGIRTLGAGGGTIAWIGPDGLLKAGPRSAGAAPGPACYGLGGEQPTVTDANVLLGRLLEDSPLAGGVQLSYGAAERAMAGLAAELELDPLELAEGVVRVAEAEMLAALRLVTIERGIDPRGLVLLPFGGARHARLALAEQLGISRLLCPRASGVLSAVGLAAAAPRRDQARTVLLSGDSLTAERLLAEREALLAGAGAALGTALARARVRHELRYAGQSFELAVDEELPVGEARAGEAVSIEALPVEASPGKMRPPASAPSSCGRHSPASTSAATDTANPPGSSSW